MTATRSKILITGASGTLGGSLCRLAVKQWTVLGVGRLNPVRLPGVTSIRADLSDDRNIRRLLGELNPGAVIHAAALAQPAACERDPRASAAINVRAPAVLAEWCAEKRIPYVFTSTDLVFDGRQAPYEENHPVSPVCVYGRQKAQAEEMVLQCYPDALVCRLPLLFGVTADESKNFTCQMLSDIRHGRPVNLFADEFRTPVDIHSAARGILTVMGRTHGLLHMGGRTRISRYDLGVAMARHLDADLSLLQPVGIGDISLSVARSPDCSLDSRKAYGYGYAPATLTDAVRRVVAEFKAAHQTCFPNP